MNKDTTMKYKLLQILLPLCLLASSLPVFAAQSDWSDWNRLEDRALNGIYFSHKKECSDGTDNCTLRWRWRNRYETDMAIDYRITYKVAGGTKDIAGQVRLRSGVNESPNFTTIGKGFDGVSVGIIASEEAKETARMQAERELQVKAERKLREEEEARQRQQESEEAARLAMLRAQEDRQREQDAKEEEARKDERLRAREQTRRQEAEEADREYKRQINASVQDFNSGMQQIIDRNVQTINDVYNSAAQKERDRAEAQQQRREQDEFRRQKEDEDRRRRETWAKIRADEERERKAEQQRQERERKAREEAERKKREECRYMTSFVKAKVTHPTGKKGRDGVTVGDDGMLLVPGEMDIFMNNTASESVVCQLVPIRGGVPVRRDMNSYILKAFEKNIGKSRTEGRTTWWGDYGGTDTVRYSCVPLLSTNDSTACNLKALGLER